jgi:hypothetical protein
LSRARSAKGESPLVRQPSLEAKFTVSAPCGATPVSRRAVPSYLGRNHRRRDKGRRSQIGKVPLSHNAAAGLANHQRERQNSAVVGPTPCRMLSVWSAGLSAYAWRRTTTRGSPNRNYCGSTKLATDGEFEKQGAGFIGSRSRLDHCAAGRCLRGCGALCPLFLGICARVSGESQSSPPRPIHLIQCANAAIEPARRVAVLNHVVGGAT